MDRREHHRVHLRIPARLRWTTPLGQKTEVCNTSNISRGGLLVPCRELHTVGLPLWITIPFDASVPYGQPEILARLVWSRNGIGQDTAAQTTESTDEFHMPAATLQFEIASRPESNGNSHQRELERRTSPRRHMALPVHVRPEGVPWFEEAMTVDLSDEGLRFLSNREYQPGQYLIVSFQPSVSSPWPDARAFRSLVVCVERARQNPTLGVTVLHLA
jgi:hypothetical protein